MYGSKLTSFSVGIEMNVVFVCGQQTIFFLVWGSIGLILCGSKLTWFLCARRV